MIAIVDYGAGNLHSIHRALIRAGLDARITDVASDVDHADALVIPGDGAFGPAMQRLRAGGFPDRITAFVRSGLPFFGICLGMQLLFSESEEDGRHQGLRVLPGRVVRLPDRVKVPHMGWNQLWPVRPSPLLDGIAPGAYVYFVHSFHAVPDDPGLIAAQTEYGGAVTAVAGRDNVWATQFHPEKSGAAGLRMIVNFARWSIGAHLPRR